VAAYQNADLVLLNGGGYARWISRATLSRHKRVDTSAAFADQRISRKDSVTHGHGPTGTHSHAEAAGEVWLDPELARAQALAVKLALASARPAATDRFEAAFLALEADLRALDLRLERASTPLRDVGLVFSHPVYSYLERRYGLRGPSLDWEPDERPTEQQWRELESRLARQSFALMLWEAAPLPEVARRLGALGLQVVVYEPAANAAAAGNWLEVMQRNAGNLEAAAAAQRDRS
jgi:zinc transport system substrate-binding protein